MGGHEDGGLEVLGGAAEEVEDEVAGGGVEIADGLVGEQEFGFVDESAGDGDALNLTAGELVGHAVGIVSEFDPGEGFEGGFSGVGGAGEQEGEFDVFGDGEGGEELEILEDEADFVAAEGGELGVVEVGGDSAVDGDGAGRGEVHGAGEVEQGGFTAAAAADEGDELAGVEGKRNPIEGRHLLALGLIVLGYVFNLKNGHLIF